MPSRLTHVARELREHAPYTALGAATGVVVMLVVVLSGASRAVSRGLFETLHPLHVVLSALATTSMYRLHGGGARRGGRAWVAVLIGYTGAVGIATLSDAVAPFLGGTLLGAEMEFHLPFLDPDPVLAHVMRVIRLPTWLVVNACALGGVALGLWRPTTRLPHMGHTLLSTWASLFGLTAFAAGEPDWLRLAPFVFVFLFLAVWLPCCVSDIVYPLLWAGDPAGMREDDSSPPSGT